MKKCWSCGNETEDDVKFCDKCGAQLTSKTCPTCNQVNKPGAKFCTSCGNNLKRKRLNLNKILKKTKILFIPIIILVICFLGYLSVSYLSKYKVGDVIEFGNYYQDDLNKKTPIKWIVLEVKDDKALLISELLMDAQPYNKEDVAITWEYSSIRHWLNNEFINEAFTQSEQNKINLTYIYNNDNVEYVTIGGKITQDKIFLLSLDEVYKYLPNENQRAIKVTKYAIKRGAYVCDSDSCIRDGIYGNGYWWLRSPGSNQNRAACVRSDGDIYGYGRYVNDNGNAVRPALFINL